MKVRIGKISKTQPHLLADVAEILLLSGEFDEVSPEDLASVLAQEGEEEEEIEESARPLTTPPANDDEGEQGSAEISARERQYISDCYVQLSYRQNHLGNHYPFLLDGNFLRKKKINTDAANGYKFLLICSRQRSFPGLNIQHCSSAFEDVCAQALSVALPTPWVVQQFGPTARKEFFGGELKRAFGALANLVQEDCNNKAVDEYNTSGDGGLDLVATFPFNDSAYGSLTLFGQCAAREKDWKRKAAEGSPDSVRRIFYGFTSWPLHSLFIPICFRQANGGWVNHKHFMNAVVFDRVRLCSLRREMPLPASAAKIIVALEA